jgi:hypothetical protein
MERICVFQIFHTHTHTHTQTLADTDTDTHTRSLSLSLSLTDTQTRTHARAHTLSHTRTHGYNMHDSNVSSLPASFIPNVHKQHNLTVTSKWDAEP